MNIINQANYYMNIIIFATVLIVAILAALLYYFVKVKKVTAAEEHINYDAFNRWSIMEYCKFDDIVSDTGDVMTGAGMMVINENTFVTGIDVTGYNYNQAAAGEKQRTMMGGIAFATIIDQRIQMRQSVEAIDIQYNIDLFIAAREKETRRLVELRQQYQDIVLQSDNRKEDPELMDIILENISQLEKKIASCEWRIREADEVIAYEKILQKSSNSTNRINQIMFSFKYNPDEFTEELTREEIWMKAMNALMSKINIYSNALSNCGCSCRALNATQLTALIRRHMHPNTADSVDINEILSTEMETLFVTSNSLLELERERIGEADFLSQLAQAEETLKNESDAAASRIERELNFLEDRADAYMEEILMEGEVI